MTKLVEIPSPGPELRNESFDDLPFLSSFQPHVS